MSRQVIPERNSWRRVPEGVQTMYIIEMPEKLKTEKIIVY
jgi:hypothetical protein